MNFVKQLVMFVFLQQATTNFILAGMAEREMCTKYMVQTFTTSAWSFLLLYIVWMAGSLPGMIIDARVSYLKILKRYYKWRLNRMGK